MSPESLKEFEALFLRSPRKAALWFSELLDSPAHRGYRVPTEGAQGAVYLADRIGADINATSSFNALGGLLHIAGAGPAMQCLRKLQDGMPPLEPQWRVPEKDWVTANERPSTWWPTAQAQACLRILQSDNDAHTRNCEWVVPLVQRRLVQLLLDFPMLMHPRLVYDFESKPSGIGLFNEPVPMFHAILYTPRAGLPSPGLDASEDSLKDFASHPVLALAARSKSKALGPTKSHRFLQNKTPATQLMAQVNPAPLTAYAMLHLESLRRAEGIVEPLLSTSNAGAEARDHLVRLSFKAAWQNLDGSEPAYMQELLSEMRLSKEFGSDQFRTSMMYDAHRTLVEDPPGGGSLALVQGERFGRLVDALEAAGVFESAAKASIAVMRELFPLPEELRHVSAPAPLATPEVACSIIQRWLDAGVELGEVVQRVRTRHADSVFDQVASAMHTEHVMSAIIEANAAQESAATVVPAARRARALL